MKTKREIIEANVVINNEVVNCFTDVIESMMSEYAQQEVKLHNGETVKIREVCLKHQNGKCYKNPSPDNCDFCTEFE